MLASEPRAVSAHYDKVSGRVTVELADGCAYVFPVSLVQDLQGVHPEALDDIEVERFRNLRDRRHRGITRTALNFANEFVAEPRAFSERLLSPSLEGTELFDPRSEARLHVVHACSISSDFVDLKPCKGMLMLGCLGGKHPPMWVIAGIDVAVEQIVGLHREQARARRLRDAVSPSNSCASEEPAPLGGSSGRPVSRKRTLRMHLRGAGVDKPLGTGSVESPEYVVGPARKAIHEVVRERKKLAVLKKKLLTRPQTPS